MVQDQATVPAEYDYDRILSVKPVTWGVVSHEKYKALFGQYFRFDALDQQRVFYREVQLFLSSVCESMLAGNQSHRISRVSVGDFEPECVARRSKYWVGDSLMDCCLVITRAGFLSEKQGAVILHDTKKFAVISSMAGGGSRLDVLWWTM